MAASVGGGAVASSQGIAPVNAFPDEKRVREVTEQIRLRLSHAHQLKLATSQQQQSTPAAAIQISQAEEIKKRLQEAIGFLQETVKDLSLAGIQDWLSGLAQRLNLKLEMQRSQQSPESNMFLVHEGFYVEICCHDSGKVTSVKLSQANTTQESVELASLLGAGDFAEFETHLKSLVQFYNQAAGGNCEPALMYRALSAMEAVLSTINQYCPSVTMDKVIMENPLGHVTPRRGGIPMQLTFFVHPYEAQKNALVPSKLGVSVGVAGKVTMEKSLKISMLSTDPNLYDVSSANFYPVTVQNSSMLPLTFVFELNEAIPLCSLVRDELVTICGTEQPVFPVGSVHINQLIAKHKSEKEGKVLITDKWQLVCLPDQYHYYLMPAELRSVDALPDQIASSQLCGAMISKVPYLHPGKVFNIIHLLRKQLVYNALLSSCLGRSRRGMPSPPSEVAQCIFEIMSQPPNQVTVTMDMQSDETLIVEFLVPDHQNPTAVEVRVKTTTDSSSVPQKLLSEIAQRCLSVPVSLRAAMKHPTQLLGNKAALLIQQYSQSMKTFDRSINSEVMKGEEVCVAAGTVPMDISDHVLMQ